MTIGRFRLLISLFRFVADVFFISRLFLQVYRAHILLGDLGSECFFGAFHPMQGALPFQNGPALIHDIEWGH